MVQIGNQITLKPNRPNQIQNLLDCTKRICYAILRKQTFYTSLKGAVNGTVDYRSY